jgi:hypothetical protein
MMTTETLIHGVQFAWLVVLTVILFFHKHQDV